MSINTIDQTKELIKHLYSNQSNVYEKYDFHSDLKLFQSMGKIKVNDNKSYNIIKQQYILGGTYNS